MVRRGGSGNSGGGSGGVDCCRAVGVVESGGIACELYTTVFGGDDWVRSGSEGGEPENRISRSWGAAGIVGERKELKKKHHRVEGTA